MLAMPTHRALGLDSSIMLNSNIILQLQQMRQILDEVRDFAEWMDVVQEVVQAQVGAIPVLEGYFLEEVIHGEGDFE